MTNSTLALDLGTHTGFALTPNGGKATVSGTWEFRNSRHEGGGSRYLRFRQKLVETYNASRFDRVFYEEVRRHEGTDAAHVYGGLLAILTSFCEEHMIAYEGVPVGTIKKYWAGKGNASKQMMIDGAVLRGIEVHDDNEADAVALLHWALENRCAEVRAALPPAPVQPDMEGMA